MPIIRFAGTDIPCTPGSNLRDVLLRAGQSPHNGITRLANCHGLGTCATCAVEVEGEVPPPGWLERLRLKLLPNRGGERLRLACKTQVLSDVRVIKHPGFWGHK